MTVSITTNYRLAALIVHSNSILLADDHLIQFFFYPTQPLKMHKRVVHLIDSSKTFPPLHSLTLPLSFFLLSLSLSLSLPHALHPSLPRSPETSSPCVWPPVFLWPAGSGRVRCHPQVRPGSGPQRRPGWGRWWVLGGGLFQERV